MNKIPNLTREARLAEALRTNLRRRKVATQTQKLSGEPIPPTVPISSDET